MGRGCMQGMEGLHEHTGMAWEVQHAPGRVWWVLSAEVSSGDPYAFELRF